MIDKKQFGTFIREKRLEKGLTQRELAEQLFVSESAVSKWEMAKSYPDITLITDICRALDISERELIAGANDTEYRLMRREAKLYRRISEAYFWGFTVAYALAMVICLVCDLAINRRLTFSVIVFGALITAYSFVPTWIRFTEKHKLALFVGTTYLSLVFLFLICCLPARQSWWGSASAGVLLGYAVFFLPFLLRRYLSERSKQFAPLIYFTGAFICLLLLLAVVRLTAPFSLKTGVLIALYCFLPLWAISLLHPVKMGRCFKAAVDVFIAGIVLYGLQGWIALLTGGGARDSYSVNLADWQNHINGNIALLVLLAAVTAAAVLALFGAARRGKSK